MTILILGGTDDEHAAHMLDVLRKRGHDAELLDSRWFPQTLGLAFDPVREAWALRLPGGRRLDGRQVKSVYWRCYNGIGAAELPDSEQSYIAANDSRGLFESLLVRLPARWVNGWAAFKSHQTKPVQLATVARLGVRVPATMLANDAEVVRAFAARHPASIFKPVQGGAHTRPLTPGHLTDDNLKNLAYAPVTIQEEVTGTNIRVFVAGRRVLACEVDAPTLDFRDTADPRIVAHALPPAIEDACLRIARALGLLWTGIDLRLTPAGEYVFLEANPSPMFVGFESRCGLPLTDALADLLTAEAV